MCACANILPDVARGQKMSIPPPSSAGTNKLHRFSQNSLCSGVSRVLSDRLLPESRWKGKDHVHNHVSFKIHRIINTHCEIDGSPLFPPARAGPASERSAQTRLPSPGPTVPRESLCGRTEPRSLLLSLRSAATGKSRETSHPPVQHTLVSAFSHSCSYKRA